MYAYWRQIVSPLQESPILLQYMYEQQIHEATDLPDVQAIHDIQIFAIEQ